MTPRPFIRSVWPPSSTVACEAGLRLPPASMTRSGASAP